jgi:hypothetical protein
VTTTQDVLEELRQGVIDALGDSTPVVIDNSPVPDFASVWARVVTTVDSATVVTDPDRYRWSGQVLVSIYAPRASGDAAVLAKATAVQTAFRGWRSASPMIIVTSVSLVGTSVYGDGWSGRTVRLSWTADLPE